MSEAITKRFVQHLDPVVAKSCLKKREAIYPEEYNWIVGAKSVRGRRMRLDALDIFPALSLSSVLPFHAEAASLGPSSKGRLCPVGHKPQDSHVRGLTNYSKVVDEGQPLINGLARMFGVRPVAVRALRGVTNRVGSPLVCPPLGWEDILRTLDAIPPERHPKSSEEWRSFSILYAECVRLYQAMKLVNATVAKSFMETTARSWMT